MVGVKGVQHGGRHRAPAQRCGADVVNFLHRCLDVDPQNVDLVGVAQNLAEQPRAVIQRLRQTERAVPFHSGAQQCVGTGIVQIVPDASLVEQHRDAQRGVADRLCIDKCVVAAQLLKAAYIVQDAGQPRQIDILRRQGQALGNAGAERRHAVGMVDFQFDLGVSGVVVRGIVGKGFLCAGTVNFHTITSLFQCTTSGKMRKLQCL